MGAKLLSAEGSSKRGRRSWWMAFCVGLTAVLAIGLPGIRTANEPLPAAKEPVLTTNLAPKPKAAASSGSDRTEPNGDPAGQAGKPLAHVSIHVWLTKEKRLETVPMEIYVRGVLAGEMPDKFALEALKAQAVAARTYIVKRLRDGEKMTFGDQTADVDDTQNSQVYIPLHTLLDEWPKAGLEKLDDAVKETEGEIITYEGQPIQAVFFSTSNGFTENSEDYWPVPLPYLRSVPSPWDPAISPRYKETVTMSLEDFYGRLGVSREGSKGISVISRTNGNRIKQLAVGKTVLSGKEVRERLGLHSAEFTWKITGSEIVITTYGFGHGVGMSQWGANGMAKAGKTATQILEYYYTGVSVEQVSKLP
jgi:stage II sporulation protein D